MDKELDRAIRNTLIGGVRLLAILFLSVGFLGLGMLKLVGQPEIIEHFKTWNIPSVVMYIIGTFELVIAVGIFYQPTRKISSIITCFFMLVISGFHLVKGDYTYLIAPTVILFISFILFIIESRIQNQNQ